MQTHKKHVFSLLIALCVGWLFLVPLTWAQPGNPVIRNLKPDGTPQGLQLLTVAVTPEGVAYFGTQEGIVRFDGNSWEHFTLSFGKKKESVTALSLIGDHTLLVGTKAGRIYYAEPQAGRFRLIDSLGKVVRGQAVRGFAALGKDPKQAQYFAYTDARILELGLTPQKPSQFLPESWYQGATLTGVFGANGALFLNLDGKGLHHVNGTKLEKVKNGELLDSASIRFAVPSDRPGTTLIGASDGRLFWLKGFILSEFQFTHPEAFIVQEYFKQASLSSAAWIGPDKVAIGTTVGALVIDPRNGGLKYLFNIQSGMADNAIQALGADASENLWMVHGAGASVALLRLGLSDLAVYTGLPSTALNDVVEEETSNLLFAATNTGVYRLVKQNVAGRASSVDGFREQQARRLAAEYEQQIQRDIESEVARAANPDDILQKLMREVDAKYNRLKEANRVKYKGKGKKFEEAEAQRIKDYEAEKRKQRQKANQQAAAAREDIEQKVRKRYQSFIDGRANSDTELFKNQFGNRTLPTTYLDDYSWQAVRGISGKCFRLEQFGPGRLLTSTPTGFFVITGESAEKVLDVRDPITDWALDRNGVLWYATDRQVIHRVKLEAGASEADEDVAIPGEVADRFTLARINNDMVLQYEGELWVYDGVRFKKTAGTLPGDAITAIRNFRRGEFFALTTDGVLRGKMGAKGLETVETWPITRVLDRSVPAFSAQIEKWWMASSGRVIRGAVAPKAVNQTGFKAIVARVVSGGDTLRLPSDNQRQKWATSGDAVQLLLSAPSVWSAEGAEFSWRISPAPEGVSADFSPWSADPYLNLPPLESGSYKLEIRARNALDQKAEATTYQLSVGTSFLEEYLWPLIAGLVVLFGVLSWLVVRYRTAQLRRRNEILEALAAEKAQEAKELLYSILPQELASDLEMRNALARLEGEERKRFIQKNRLDDSDIRRITRSIVADSYPRVTVLFTDFVGFTHVAEKLSPEALIEELNRAFSAFDMITEKYGLEKIKTIGDAYMAAGGVPEPNLNNPIQTVLAGLEMQKIMAAQRKMLDGPQWKLRLGIHTGSVVAGVIGAKKFAYDIWGDAVNLAARMESSGEIDKVNVSAATYEFVKDYFECTERGLVDAKNKGKVMMYTVDRLKPQYASDAEGLMGGEALWEAIEWRPRPVGNGISGN